MDVKFPAPMLTANENCFHILRSKLNEKVKEVDNLILPCKLY